VPFELFVALRFLREGRAQTALILAGTTVGVAVIVFLTALIGGLQDTLIDQTLSSQAHVVLKRPERVPRALPPPPGAALAALVEKAPERERSVEQWQQVLAEVRETRGIVAATPTASGSAFASRAEVSRSVSIRGVEPGSFDAVIRIADTVREGRFRVEGGECLIGTELASALGLAVGDRLRLTTAEGRGELFSVAGLFDIGNKEVNERWVLVSLRSAQTLLDLSGGITAIEAKVEDVFEADRIALALGARTGLATDSWMRSNKRLLDGLRSQSASSYMIQTFVILAVALGIASVLGVSVIQKSREIGILKATGTSTPTVMRIFLIEGGIVGVVGSVAGGALGALLSFAFQLSVTNPYGESLFPIALSPRLFFVAGLVATATGLAAAWLPARRAALLDPAVVIRYG
jgi:lipoprotein-releasing system permease protein